MVLSGILTGVCNLPVKFMKNFKFEHWCFLSSFFGHFFLPWLLLIMSVDIISVIPALPLKEIILANTFSSFWGLANVLGCISLVRIGFSLSIGTMVGVALPVGVIVPMVFKASGIFSDAPDLFSRTGFFVIPGIIIMLASLVLMSIAGFAREKTHKEVYGKGGYFVRSFIMCVIGGLLGVGLAFAFVYTQGPVGDVLKAKGAGEAGIILGLWALMLPGAAAVNMLYSLWLMHKNKNGYVIMRSKREIGLSMLIGIIFISFLILYGVGSRMMGAFGSSVGFAIYQGLMIITIQLVGFIGGEWRGTARKNIHQMFTAIALAVISVLFFTISKF